MTLELCFNTHIETKPWIPNYYRTLISPLREVDPEFLGRKVMTSRTDPSQSWYEPSLKFWRVHCERAHRGEYDSDLQLHLELLTREGKNAEFLYGIQYYDETGYPIENYLTLEGRTEFQAECEWFRREALKISSHRVNGLCDPQ